LLRSKKGLSRQEHRGPRRRSHPAIWIRARPPTRTQPTYKGVGSRLSRFCGLLAQGVEGLHDVAGVQNLGDSFNAVTSDAGTEQGHGQGEESGLVTYPAPRYDPVNVCQPGTAEGIWSELQAGTSSVVFYMGHASVNGLWVSGDGTQILFGGYPFGTPEPNTPDACYLENLSSGALSRCALVVFGGCLTGVVDCGGRSLPGSAIGKGAATAVGFTGSPSAYVTYFGAFGESLMKWGHYVEVANVAGKQAVFDAYGQYHGTDTLVIFGKTGQVVRPARFGS
jgi:hypothetical protein